MTTEISQRVRSVAEVRSEEPIILSAYISLDPHEFPTAKQRVAEIESLNDRARAIVSDLTLSHDSFRGVSDDIERVRSWAKSDMDPDGAQSVAVFCCSALGLFETFKLSTTVEPAIHVDNEPHLEQLTAAVPSATWCVFLVSRSADRILRGTRDRLIEMRSENDEVHGQHNQGGWSQARFQRSVDKDVADHVQAACNRLFESYKRVPFDKLLLGSPSELRPEVKDKLHPYLADRLAGECELDIEHTNADQVLDAVRDVMETDERREEAALIERLAEQLGRGERAVSGIDATLQALDERRVEILLIDPNRRSDDLIEMATRDAVLQDATVHEIRYHEPERAIGGPIAALLRF